MSAIPFSVDEAQAVARALAAVAASDGAILAREASFLDSFAMSHSVGGMSFIPEPLDVDKLARAIRDDDKRHEVVRLCIRMAVADGDFADAERATVARIAAAFAIADDELARMTSELLPK